MQSTDALQQEYNRLLGQLFDTKDQLNRVLSDLALMRTGLLTNGSSMQALEEEYKQLNLQYSALQTRFESVYADLQQRHSTPVIAVFTGLQNSRLLGHPPQTHD